LKSNHSDPGSPEGLRYDEGLPELRNGLPRELAEALERSRARLARLVSSVIFLPTVGSTNDVAATIAAEGAVVVADCQTAGRGRRGHSWFSPAGSGVCLSIVLTPARATDPDRATSLLTLAAGVAVSEGVSAATGLSTDLKWPNDIFAGRRKLAGILAEAADGVVVLGYGINVTPASYPPELGDRATSLESELGRVVDRHDVLVESLAALARRYDDLLNGRFDAILDAWRARAPSAIGAHVTWNQAETRHSGVTAGIDNRGALLVRVGDRVERIVSGELNWF
jgi:BirA family biotin operon repressor/biotin-[acetyl-CoA-carboxylase] ligase